MKVLALFKEYLEYGYYPYFQEFKDKAQFYMTLEQNVHTTLESDLPAIHQSLSGSSIHKMHKLLSIVAALVPFTPDMKQLKHMLGIGDERTLKSYLKYLEDAGVILTVSKSGKGLNPRYSQCMACVGQFGDWPRQSDTALAVRQSLLKSKVPFLVSQGSLFARLSTFD